MTDNATQNSKPPVLGVDPPEPKTTPPAPKPNPAPRPPEPDPSLVTIDAEELQALQEAAGNYKTLVGDEQLQAVIYGHLRDRMSGIVSPQHHQDQNTPPNEGSNPLESRLARVEQFLQEGAQHIKQQQSVIQRQADEIATLRTDLFARDHPSFKQNQVAVSKLLKDNPGLSLEDALLFVEAKAARAGNGTVDGDSPAAPTTEGGSAGNMPNTTSSPGGISDDRLAELADKINDPKATPSMDDAFDAIGRAAGLDI